MLCEMVCIEAVNVQCDLSISSSSIPPSSSNFSEERKEKKETLRRFNSSHLPMYSTFFKGADLPIRGLSNWQVLPM